MEARAKNALHFWLEAIKVRWEGACWDIFCYKHSFAAMCLGETFVDSHL
jgi:hypothetical protein